MSTMQAATAQIIQSSWSSGGCAESTARLPCVYVLHCMQQLASMYCQHEKVWPVAAMRLDLGKGRYAGPARLYARAAEGFPALCDILQPAAAPWLPIP